MYGNCIRKLDSAKQTLRLQFSRWKIQCEFCMKAKIDAVACDAYRIALMSSSTLDSNSNCYVISIEYLCVCSIPKFSVKCGTAMGIWHHFELLPSVLDVIVAICSLQNTITLDTIAFCWLTEID